MKERSVKYIAFACYTNEILVFQTNYEGKWTQ